MSRFLVWFYTNRSCLMFSGNFVLELYKVLALVMNRVNIIQTKVKLMTAEVGNMFLCISEPSCLLFLLYPL